MKAIQVRFIPATNTRPARVKATAEGVPSITMSYDYDGDASYTTVAHKLAAKYGWWGRWVAGGLPDGSQCFVPVDGWHDGFTVDAAIVRAEEGNAA